MADVVHASLSLAVEDLTIIRPDGEVLLRDVSLAIDPAELVLLVGPSGSGKSTLLLLLAGLLDTGPGNWRVSGRLTCGDEGFDLAHQQADVGGVVFQHYALFDDLDAQENLRIALDHAPRGTDAMAADVAAMLGDINPRQSIASCSGGQRQRLAIARTVIANQPVLLFDEPNSGLDIASARRLLEVIRGLCGTMGKPALIAVHHFEELLPLADRVVVIDPRTRRLVELPPEAGPVEAKLEEAAAAPAHGRSGRVEHGSRWRLPSRHRSQAWWFARYVVGYFWLLCAAPIMLLYMGAGAAIIGFVTVWFGFNYHSFGGVLKSVLHDETLVGLGMVQSRVAIPLIANLLFVARNSAVIAADVGNRVMSSQFQAMDNLNIPGRAYVFSSIVITMVAGSIAYLLLSLLLGSWASQETWHVQFPTQYRALFRTQFFRNVLDENGWPLPVMGWVVVKAGVSALLAATSSILIALGPKPSSQAVNTSVANAIVIGVILTLIVHAGISILTN
jgi:ABC-type lipoprotein export system ATPase subunit/ABC-type transporter Mla maintaining outer membrane lipid asymmetry permease subunit MlaE